MLIARKRLRAIQQQKHINIIMSTKKLDRVITPEGPGIRKSVDAETNIAKVVMESDSALPGGTRYYDNVLLKKETFFNYCTRRSGFGRTSWPEFSIILAAVIGIPTYVYFEGNSAFWWAFGLCSAVLTVFVQQTWANYVGKVV